MIKLPSVKLIRNWRDAYKMRTVQIAVAGSMLAGLYAANADALQALVPADKMAAGTAIVLAIIAVYRIVDQGIQAGFAAAEAAALIQEQTAAPAVPVQEGGPADGNPQV